jgi:hypothetical protein
MEPALSPEEWRGLTVKEGPDWWDGEVSADEEYLSFESPTDPQHGTSFKVRRHAIGALALHGQPFGFTWDDVERHRAAAERAGSRWLLRRDRALREQGSGNEAGFYSSPEAIVEADAIDEERRWHESMAERIAALLPPMERQT